MTSESRSCQNCTQVFVIDAADFTFYEKMRVPAPSLCFTCRMQRKIAFRNERRLYKRPCDLCSASVVSAYSDSAPFPVYCDHCWWSDKWDAMAYGRAYNPARPFFAQFQALEHTVPHLALININNVASPYANWLDDSKNCYMVFGSSRSEDCMYSELLLDCKDTADSSNATALERCYQCINGKKSYRCIWCVDIADCSDVLFSFDCVGCSNCLFSYNLRHKKYHIDNKPYAKEAYEQEVKRILGSHKNMQDALAQFKNIVAQKALHRFGKLIKCTDATGNDLINCGRARYCFDSSNLEDCKYTIYGVDMKDTCDVYGAVRSSLAYEITSITESSMAVGSMAVWGSCHNNFYSQFTRSSNDVLGCYGINHKAHCILNRQYAPEEYTKLREQIVQSMKQRGEYGAFFPITLSPFGYNETIAQDYFPLTKAEAAAKGYPWQEAETGKYHIATVSWADIPDRIADVTDAILNQILDCTICGKSYKIIETELAFYRTHLLPIPRMCNDCRYRERLQFRNPRFLYRRSCQCGGQESRITNQESGRVYRNTATHRHGAGPCPNEFETSYAPERPEVVYCEACYKAEVI